VIAEHPEQQRMVQQHRFNTLSFIDLSAKENEFITTKKTSKINAHMV
jgi:hypothetical protein